MSGSQESECSMKTGKPFPMRTENRLDFLKRTDMLAKGALRKTDIIHHNEFLFNGRTVLLYL